MAKLVIVTLAVAKFQLLANIAHIQGRKRRLAEVVLSSNLNSNTLARLAESLKVNYSEQPKGQPVSLPQGVPDQAGLI